MLFTGGVPKAFKEGVVGVGTARTGAQLTKASLELYDAGNDV